MERVPKRSIFVYLNTLKSYSMIKKQFTILGTALVLASGVFSACKNNETTDHKASSTTTVSNTGIGEAIDLKFKLPEGAKYQLKTNITQSMSSPQGKITNEMDMEFSYAAIGKETAHTLLELTYDRIRMKMSGAGMPSMEMDTEKGTDEGTAALKKLIGQKLTMKVSPEVKVMDITGWEQMFTGKGNAGMSLDDIKQSMELSMNIYPGQPVRVGDTWTINTVQRLNAISMNVANTFTLTEVKDNTATLDISSEINPGDAPKDPAMAAIQMEIRGTQKGTYKVDIATGMIKEGKLVQQMKASSNKSKELSMDIESEIEFDAEVKK
jgi:hypothetical protein